MIKEALSWFIPIAAVIIGSAVFVGVLGACLLTFGETTGAVLGLIVGSLSGIFCVCFISSIGLKLLM